MKVLLLAMVSVLLLAAACGEDGDKDLVKNADGFYVIERLALEDADLETSDLFEPDFSNPYPEVVATVNGEEITGVDLFVKQVAQELELREAISWYVRVALIMNTGGDPKRPLESLIDERLLDQVILSRELAQSAEEVDASALEEELTRLREVVAVEEITEERRLAAQTAVDEMEEVLRLQGLPLEGWTATAAYVEKHRILMGRIPLAREECPRFGFEFSVRETCGDFLAAEREKAVIEYLVVWAE